MQTSDMILVNSKVLPEVFSRVLLAKQMLNSGEYKSAAECCNAAGISRSAFYKYKDYVFEYSDKSGTIVTVHAVLRDKAGVLSKFMSILYESGANILTVNQSIPTGGKAVVSVSFRKGQLKISVSELVLQLKSLDGVKSVEQISGE